MAEEQHTDIMATINQVRNEYNILQVRLDTGPVIEQAKMFLNSEIEIVREGSNGMLQHQVIKIGPPKANKRGTAAILNWMQMIVNSQVVQGNFPMDKKGVCTMYDMYIEECQKDLGDLLIINLYNYDIDDDELQGIIDAMMNLIKPFMTRPIANKERDSYGQTMRSIETNKTNLHGGGGGFGFKN